MWQHRGQQRPDFALPTGSGQESVWDYPRPPALVPCNQRVEIYAGSNCIASSSNCLRLLETASPPTFYVPPTDVDWALLVPAAGHSVCEWKGAASYWALAGAADAIAWSYAEPREPYTALRGFLSCYPAQLQCTVDGEQVRPQPGGFYGGWVTDSIVGPYKGEPGTGHW